MLQLVCPDIGGRNRNHFGTFNRECLQSVWQGGRKVSIHLLNTMGTVVFGSCYFEVAITFDLESWKSRVSAIRIALLVGIQSQLESVFASPRSKKSLVHLPSWNHLDRSNYTPATVHIHRWTGYIINRSPLSLSNLAPSPIPVLPRHPQASWTAWVVLARRWGSAVRSWGASLDWSMLWGGCWCAFPSTTHVPGQQGDGHPFHSNSVDGKGQKEFKWGRLHVP